MNSINHRTETANAIKIFLDNSDLIRNIISFHIHDEYQADDMFQDFFLSFISHSLPEDIQNIELYLYRAITNDIIDELRHRGYGKKPIYEYDVFTTGSCKPKTPEEIATMIDEINRVFHLIERWLSPIEAQAVYLQYHDDLSAREIAKKMDVGASTIRGYVSKGLKRIRELVDERPFR